MYRRSIVDLAKTGAAHNEGGIFQFLGIIISVSLCALLSTWPGKQAGELIYAFVEDCDVLERSLYGVIFDGGNYLPGTQQIGQIRIESGATN